MFLELTFTESSCFGRSMGHPRGNFMLVLLELSVSLCFVVLIEYRTIFISQETCLQSESRGSSMACDVPVLCKKWI